MKNEFKKLLFISLILVCSSSFLFTKVNALEYFYENGSPREGTQPPEITIQSPKNNKHYNTITLSFNVTVGNSTTAYSRHLKTITYTADWQPNSTIIFEDVADVSSPTTGFRDFSTSIKLNDVPEGNHSILIFANEIGAYRRIPFPWHEVRIFTIFEMNKLLTVNFIVDTVPPEVMVLSPENKAYPDQEVDLSCLFNEEVTKISYSLDGLDNMTFNGDIILTDLQAGDHQLIVYSEDLAGNIGSSDIIYFSVESFPTLLVLTISVIVTVVGLGILAYFKKYKK